MQFYLGPDPTTVEINTSFSIAFSESWSCFFKKQFLWSSDQCSWFWNSHEYEYETQRKEKKKGTNQQIYKISILKGGWFCFARYERKKNGRKIKEIIIFKEVVSLSRVRKINYNVINRCPSKAIAILCQGESTEELKIQSLLHRLNLVEKDPWKQKQCVCTSWYKNSPENQQYRCAIIPQAEFPWRPETLWVCTLLLVL